jgi:uncharacterized protein (TIGR02246 family)
MTDADKATLERANAAIAAGDHETFLSLCTDDTVWTFVGDTTITGKDELRRWMADAYQDPPRFDVHRMVAEGDTVVAIGEITTKGDDGNDVRNEYCDVWRFRDGKMAELRAFVVPLPPDD